jgi:hypothetical protein
MIFSASVSARSSIWRISSAPRFGGFLNITTTVSVQPLVPADVWDSQNPGLRSLTYQNPAVIVAVLPEDFSAGKEIGLSPKIK